MLRFNAVVALLLCTGAVWGQEVSFRAGGSSATGNGPVAIATGDFNGDGNADVAIGNAASLSISIMLGNGDGTLQTPVTYDPVPGCEVNFLYAGDFNGDGKTDLLGNCLDSTPGLFVLPGLGDGTFGTALFTALPTTALVGFVEFTGQMAIGDFNEDGHPDLILTASDIFSISNLTLGQTTTYLLLGLGDGTFRAPIAISLGNVSGISAAAANLNGDGHADVVITTATATGAVDAHGDPLYAGSVLVLLGDGTGSFRQGPQFSLGNQVALSLAVGDVNNDGKTDVVLGEVGQPSGSATTFTGFSVLLGNGDGTLLQGYSTNDLGNSAALTLLVGDVRGTGNLDAIQSVVTVGGTGSIAIRPGNGDGTFGPLVSVPLSGDLEPLAVATTDFDNDGRLDLAVAAISAQAIQTSNGTSGLLALPAGVEANFLNTTAPTTFSNTNAASFQTGPVATSSIVTAFGRGLATMTAQATALPLPTALGGISVQVKDSLGGVRLAPLFYVSPKQFNYAIPDGTATGPAMVTIVGTGENISVPQQIATVAPGIFGVAGLAVGNVLTFQNGVQQTTNTIFVDATGKLQPTPINLDNTAAQVYLVLYGTGIRNHVSAVTATIGPVTVQAVFAGPTGSFAGEDQVNLLLPNSLKGAGLVNVTLAMDGVSTNSDQILVQ